MSHDECPPLFEESNQVVYLLISWHFISPKRIFYFNVVKELLQLLGDSDPRSPGRLCPWIRVEVPQSPSTGLQTTVELNSASDSRREWD